MSWRISTHDVGQVDGGPHRAVVDVGEERGVERRQAQEVGHVEYSQGDGGASPHSLLVIRSIRFTRDSDSDVGHHLRSSIRAC